MRKPKYRWRHLGRTDHVWDEMKREWIGGVLLYECPTCFAAVTNPGRHAATHEGQPS